MLVMCLASCGEKETEEAIEDVTDKASESTMTLAMYLMSETKVSAEQEAAIEDAVNKITKAKFKTQLDLKFFTADEYYTKLDEAFAARDKAEAEGLISQQPAASDDTAVTEAETVVNEYGFGELKYPEISEYQVDIFYMGGYDNYAKYAAMNKLQNLDTELSSASKKLNEYISSAYLKYMKSVNNGVYAIPTNAPIGEYTYLLFNKQALADTDYDTSSALGKFSGLGDPDLDKYLGEFVGSKPNGNEYAPLYSTLSNTELASLIQTFGETTTAVKYWGVGADGQLTNQFSILGSTYNVAAKLGQKETSYMEYIGDWSSTGYKSNFEKIMKYREDGYFTEDQSKAAVLCVKGGAEIPAQYEGYEAVVIGKPTMETMDLYDNMFAVTSYTANTGRSMEIITYLNTNEDFRNLLLYGIENENYELVESKYNDAEGNPYMVVKRLNENYMMDTNKLGNTLIGYCLESENPALRESIMKQNNAAVASITMGFKLDFNEIQADKENLLALRELSQTIEAKLNACTPDKLTEVVTEVNALIEENIAVITAVTSVTEPSEGSAAGLGYIYFEWAKSTGIYVEPTGDEEA